jgi:NDP-sugar pyrophosphorylase family protein
LKIIVFVSIPKNNNLFPLNKNRPAALFQVAGKNLLEWYQHFGEKNNCEEIILLVNKIDNDLVRDEVSRYMLSSEPPNKIGPFIFYDFETKKGLTQEAISNLTNEEDTLLINGDVIFTEEYLSKFLEKAKKNTILVNKNEKKCLGLALLTKGDLGVVLLEAKDINDVYKNLQTYNAKINKVQLTEEDHFWKINYLWNLLDANEIMIKNIDVKRLGTIEDGVTIIGKVLIDEGAKIRSGSYLEGPLYVGRN